MTHLIFSKITYRNTKNTKKINSSLKKLLLYSIKLVRLKSILFHIMAEEECKNLICQDDPFSDLKNVLRPHRHNLCPLRRQELGQYSWSLLHTFAAYYPENPTPEDQQSILGLLKGFRNLYPCIQCRGHFQRDFDRDPPKTQNQAQLAMWVCRQHNYVNRILGKKEFDCSLQNLRVRWRTGCQNDDQL